MLDYLDALCYNIVMEIPNKQPEIRKPEIEAAIALSRALESSLRVTIDAKREAAQAGYLARHDELTGALNRRGLKDWLETAQAPKALLLVDATNFKAINDTYGEHTGDMVIGVTYGILKESVRPQDVIARWGGDEFIIALSEDSRVSSSEKIDPERRIDQVQIEHIDPIKQRVAKNLEDFLNQGEYQKLRELNFDLAVGGVVWPGEASIDKLIEEAEKEMRNHKAQQHEAGKYRRAS